VQTRFHLILISATYCDEQSASRHSRFTPGYKLASTHQIRRPAGMCPSERREKKSVATDWSRPKIQRLSRPTASQYTDKEKKERVYE